MRRLFLALLGWVLLAASVDAQTITKTLAWTQPGEVLATVSTYTWSLKIDAAAAVAITPACQTVGGNVDCTAPITLASGNHTIVLSPINTSGVSSSSTLNYVPGASPAAPAGMKITIQITVP